MLSILRSDAELTYSGAELSPHFILKKFKMQGSSLVSFEGPCDVKTENLVDLEDKLNFDCIKARSMLHFIGEFFRADLLFATAMQRILASIIEVKIRELSQAPRPILRVGDDLYLAVKGHERKKLSVSIVAPSLVSSILHFAVNIDPEGAPVPAVGLKALGVDPKHLADEVLFSFQEEWNSIHNACSKVQAVIG